MTHAGRRARRLEWMGPPGTGAKKRLEWMDAAVCEANSLECVKRVSDSSRLLPASFAALALDFAIRVTCWDNSLIAERYRVLQEVKDSYRSIPLLRGPCRLLVWRVG